MILIEVPGRTPLEIHHLVCDVNGTLAVDGEIMDGIQESMNILKESLDIYLLTADTHGNGAAIAAELGVKVVILTPGDECAQKATFIQKLGRNITAAIGQGANDEMMLKATELGICVMSPEGTAAQALLASDVVVQSGNAALQLLIHPKRLSATLRK